MTEIQSLHGAMGILSWDQQTYMPAGGGDARANHLSTLSSVLHERMTDPATGALATELLETGGEVERIAAKRFLREHHRALRVSKTLVQALSRARTKGFAAWMAARDTEQFGDFVPALSEIIDLSKELASAHEPSGHLYDALLDEYDPGTTVADLEPLFARLEEQLVPFVRAATQQPSLEGLAEHHVSDDTLMRLSNRIISALGFRSSDGRLDQSAHPFTMGVGPHDVRLTTHLHNDDLLSTLGGTIHECGHGLYEQGLPEQWSGTGLMSAAGMGLHESQSRFWENAIGRSRAFYAWLEPIIREIDPSTNFRAEDLYRASNRVTPSLIRVRADEATYDLHVLVRYRLEVAIFSGDLSVSDLETAWNDAYKASLGVSATRPSDGVLQDIHWSSGYFGYFPSYTIGNLYAASFKKQLESEMPTIWRSVRDGEFAPILAWLRTRIHERGAATTAHQIFTDAVGDRDPVSDLMDHLRSRHGALCGVG